MKETIIYIRERITPEEALKNWWSKKICFGRLAVLSHEKEELAKSGRNVDEGYLAIDRIIDKNDGKEKTVFIRMEVADLVAVECP